MREQLLQILAEPGTRATLELRDAQGPGGRIEQGTLISTETGRAYPIVRGIPRFVDPSNYTASFGMQWNRFRRVQIDSAAGGDHSRARFDAETGWDANMLNGKWVLDAGCGAGRFSEVAAGRGPNLVSLDMSSAVEAARETLARFDNVDIVQGSLLDPPFKKGVFDFAYCIGVVQHTPAPARAVGEVIQVVKKGGQFAFTIYARRPWSKLNAKYLVRPLTKRLNQETLLSGIESVMPVVFPIANKLFKLPKLGKVVRFTLPVAVYLDTDRPTWDRDQRYRESVLDTLDMLSPAYDSPMTAKEVESVLRNAGAQTWTFRTRVPVNVTGTFGMG